MKQYILALLLMLIPCFAHAQIIPDQRPHAGLVTYGNKARAQTAFNMMYGNGGGGSLANVLGTISLLDDYPNIATATTDCIIFPMTCQGTLAQISAIHAREVAFTLKAANADSIMLRNMVEFYYPRMQIQVSNSLIVPALVGWHADGYIRRNGVGGTASTVCDTTFTGVNGVGSLTNRECPAVIFPPMAHNIGHLDVFGSTTGAGGDGGSAGYFGKAWVPSVATNPVPGLGYHAGVNPTIAIVTAFSASPTTINKTIGVSSTTNVAVGQHITDVTTSAAIVTGTQVSSFVADAGPPHSLTTSGSSAAGQAHATFASGGTACLTGEIVTDTTNAVIPAGTVVSGISTSTNVGLSQIITGGGIVLGDTIVCYPTIVLSSAVGTGGTILNDTLNLNDVLSLAQPDASPYATTKIEITGADGVTGAITSFNAFGTGLSAAGSWSLPLPLQEWEYTVKNGWTHAACTVAPCTVATSAGRGNVFDPSNAGQYMTGGGTGIGAEFTLTYVPDFGGGGADYNTVAGTIATGQVAYMGANTLFGQLSAQQVGNVNDATYGHTFGFAFNGLQFVGDTVQVTGGGYGIWIGGSDDFFFTEMNPIDSDIGMKFGPGGGGFRGFVTVDSPNVTYIMADNYNDVNISAAFLQKNATNFTGSYAMIFGENGGSASALISSWKMNITMDGAGGTSGIPAMQIANTIGSSFDFNINNYGKNGSLCQAGGNLCGLITSYATIGSNVTNTTFTGSINDAASTVFTNLSSLDSTSTIHVFVNPLGAWDDKPGHVENVSCGGTGWANTGVGTAEVSNFSVAYPKLNANDAIRVSSLWSRSGTGADSASETIRLCSGACSCVSGATCTSGSIIGSHPSTTITTSATASIPIWLANQNATNAQVMFPQTSAGNITSSGAVTTNAIQTNTGGFVNFDSTTITSSADTDKLQSYCVEVLRNPF